MKIYKLLTTLLLTIFVIDLSSNQLIFNSAKADLNLESKYIGVSYNDKEVNEFCPKQSVGCYISNEGGKIILKNNVPANHHDVVLYGLYSDYIQHQNTGLIDNLLTCDLKVSFLEKNQKIQLARLYSGTCHSIYKNKILVMN